MLSEKVKQITFLFIIIFFQSSVYSQNSKDAVHSDHLEDAIQMLQRYFSDNSNWHPADSTLNPKVSGLIHYLEDEPLDSIIAALDSILKDSSAYMVYRLPEEVSDSLNIQGFIDSVEVNNKLENIFLQLQKYYEESEPEIPYRLFTDLEDKINLVPPGQGMILFADSVYVLPDRLRSPEFIPDSMLDNADSFNRLLKLDSLRNVYVEQKREQYNDSLLNVYRDSVISKYQQEKFEMELEARQNSFLDSVKLNNYQILKQYNDSVIHVVNDSVMSVLNILIDYALFTDTTQLKILNLTQDTSTFVLNNNNNNIIRLWLKNQQNDSLGVLLKNLDKSTIQMLIDDGVSFSQYRSKETKTFDFGSLANEMSALSGIVKKYRVETPWQLTGNGTVGFTQTYIGDYWKKGGQSAFALLIVLNGGATYTRADGKVKWENSAEIRNGWMRPGGEETELKKNDDKLEITSRFGISAFKKWYYSAEMNFQTQFFNGYKYPRSENPDPISGYLAPARTFFKLGFDYKPNKEFSLLLSPVTIKNVYVRDTATYDQTKFSIEPDRKSFWEPGLNADVTIKKNITDDIFYETKYKMFINYKAPFSKFDINWENQLTFNVTEYMNMQMMFHLIYDDDVLFPVKTKEGEPPRELPRLQVKEFLTIGFTYKINKKIMKSKRIK